MLGFAESRRLFSWDSQSLAHSYIQSLGLVCCEQGSLSRAG